MRIKNFCLSKDTIKKMNTQATGLEKMLTEHIMQHTKVEKKLGLLDYNICSVAGLPVCRLSYRTVISTTARYFPRFWLSVYNRRL